MGTGGAGRGPASELERLRLENETLAGVVGVVASGPDLSHILDRVVDLLTQATGSHACFVYLRSGDSLVMRAASPVYSHLVGRISFGVEEGLAGWVMTHGRAEYIREGAIDDPRTVYVPELEEEKFQSMVAVPIASRAGAAIGTIILHSEAPREFEEGMVNVLSRAGSLVSGAIENARLYEDSRERVEELTRLSTLGRQIAAVADRTSLFTVAANGMRTLVDADACSFYETSPEDEPRRVAASPVCTEPLRPGEGEALATLLDGGTVASGMEDVFGLPDRPAVAVAVPVDLGRERFGVIVVVARDPLPSSSPELLRTAAHQVGLALEKVNLIERLTDENVARDLFDALSGAEPEVATMKSTAAGLDLTRPHLVAVARDQEEPHGHDWHQRGEMLERAARRLHPGAVCDLGPDAVRILMPTANSGTEPSRQAAAALERIAREQRMATGLGESRGGLPGITRALEEATDAARIGARLLDGGGTLLYRDSGAYRYLIDQLDSGGPMDHLRDLIEQLAAYDRERQTQLLLTLDTYLEQGRSLAATARVLWIHVNTLRQRLERMETLTGSDLASEDMLALQLAIKLARLRNP